MEPFQADCSVPLIYPIILWAVFILLCFFAQQDGPGWSYTFPAPDLESVISTRSPSSCYWKMIIRTRTRCAYFYKGVFGSRPFQWTDQRKMYTLTPEFILIPLIQIDHRRVLPHSVSFDICYLPPPFWQLVSPKSIYLWICSGFKYTESSFRITTLISLPIANLSSEIQDFLGGFCLFLKCILQSVCSQRTVLKNYLT